jgi:hypothetical protein
MMLQSKFLVSLSTVGFLCFLGLEDFARLLAWIFGLAPWRLSDCSSLKKGLRDLLVVFVLTREY